MRDMLMGARSPPWRDGHELQMDRLRADRLRRNADGVLQPLLAYRPFALVNQAAGWK
jgi:hypothetical protein